MSAEFLYPTSRQYPIDAVCEGIVRALAARNFDVPGIAVDFRTYGSGEQHVRYLSDATGENFRLSFGRGQGILPGGRWADTSALGSAAICRKHLTVYGDNSGPDLCLYVGDDWGADKAVFMAGSLSGIHDKMNGRPRKVVRYSGSYTGGRTLRSLGARTPPRDLRDCFDREYGPVGDEPAQISVDEIFTEFDGFLRGVLTEILSYPEALERVDIFPEPPAIPWPAEIGPLFCSASNRDVERIRQGQADLTILQPPYRFAMEGNAWRLVPYDVPNDGTVPEVAYSGFLWCGMGEVGPIPGHYKGFYERRTLYVRPNRANDIYIADHDAYDKRRVELSAAIQYEALRNRTEPRQRFANDEVADFTRARARTIISITEYRGDFAQPVVLINRELDFDEVEIMEDASGE